MILQHRRGSLSFEQPRLMAIVNLTPDSFSDGGQHRELDKILEHVDRCVAQGADIIDLGAESTRPDAGDVTQTQEADRLMPVLAALRSRFDVLISIDTWRAQTATQALEAGADIINDVGGGRWDRDMAPSIAPSGAGWIVMHSGPTREQMHKDHPADEVIRSVQASWALSIEAAERAGIKLTRIALDAGFGFGKGLKANNVLFRALPELAAQERPLLIGVSRKRMIRALVNGDPTLLEHANTAAHILAFERGARIIRCHEISPAAAARKVWTGLAQ